MSPTPGSGAELAGAALEPKIVTGSREQLLHLLAEAAEIEHTIMCSYLYAAFSLKRRGEPGLTDEQADAVERWRSAIMDVAVQEMGHLLIVANLTLAVGGHPHFTRPNFPVSPGYFPSAVVVRLSGFSQDTLEHFIFLERPQGVQRQDAHCYDQEDYDRSQAVEGLMPVVQDYATIGHLYEAIRANIRSLAGELGEAGLFLSGASGQLGGQDVIEDVTAIASVEAAMAGIDIIVEQGEGSPSDREDSHYRSFLAIQDELQHMRATDRAFAPAWPVADNPVLRAPQEPGDTCLIDDPRSAQLLDFACATYGLLLRTLVQSFGRTGASANADQATLLGVSFKLMHVLGAASAALARCPASPRRPDTHAGMTFTMLRGVEPMLRGKVEQEVIRERLTLLAQHTTSLDAMAPDVAADLAELAHTLRLGDQ